MPVPFVGPALLPDRQANSAIAEMLSIINR